MARLLAVYFFALLIPLVTGTLLYLSQVRDVEAEILDARERSLALNKRVVEGAILSIGDVVTEIRQDEQLEYISQLENPLENRLALRVANAYNQSRMSLAMPEYILDVVVHLKRPDLILTTGDIFFDTEVYYRSFYRLPGLSHAEWIQTLRSAPYVHDALVFQTIELDGEQRETIALRSSLPFATRLTSTGTVTAYIDLSEVEELLSTYLAGNDGFARIELPDGRRLASVGIEGGEIAVPSTPTAPQSGTQFVEVGGREYAVSYIRSEVNRWLYVSGTPIEVFFAQSNRIRLVFAGLVLLLLLVGVPIVLLQVFGLSRPIAETSRVLRDGVVLGERVGSDPFSFISNSVDELVHRDRTLRDLLSEQRPMVKGVILERLFRGDYDTDEEAKANLVHFGVEVPGGSLVVFCVLIEGYFDVATPDIVGEFIVKSALIREELEHVLPDSALIHTISHGTICIALFLDDSGGIIESGAEPTAVIEMVTRQSRALREVRCTTASGGVAADLSQVSRRVRTAIEIAERSAPGAIVTSVIEGDRHPEDYFYPTDVELSLIKAVRGGHREEVGRIATTLREANLTERSLSREGLRRFYRELEATRAKIVQRLPTDRRIPFDPATVSVSERIVLLLGHLEELAGELATEGAASNTLKASIEQYVLANAFASEMGLKMLASHFNLSEVYLSRLFPQLFGENFHSYVERTRMQQAAELLRTTRLTIEEVADRVGYQSANSFRRVFKRTYGVSPSAFDRSMA
ncbi:MAG: helix-turn-helix transcriptional regulator [Spirochaetales bacterium]